VVRDSKVEACPRCKTPVKTDISIVSMKQPNFSPPLILSLIIAYEKKTDLGSKKTNPC